MQTMFGPGPDFFSGLPLSYIFLLQDCDEYYKLMKFFLQFRGLIFARELRPPFFSARTTWRISHPACGSILKYGMLSSLAPILLIFALPLAGSVVSATGTDTDPLALDSQVRDAFEHFYILDYDGALSRFEKIQTADPDNPLAVDFVLNAVLFRELYRLDLLDTTFYAHDGFLNGKHAIVADPAVADRVNSLFTKATTLSEQRLSKNQNDVDALYARGWCRSLRAVYIGMIERGFVSALRVALQARSDDEKVLKLAPNFTDAKLVVGVHQYVTGSLPFGLKLLVGAAGITGSKSKGMDDLRDAGAHGVLTSVEARTALGLFLRREAKYEDAIKVTKSLVDQYPRNFLFRLELANLTKDAGQGPSAIIQYRQLLVQARKPGYFYSAHLELAWFGLADTLQGQKNYAEAAEAYNEATAQPAISVDLKSRCNLNSGKMYDLLNERDMAMKQYQVVLRQDADSAQADSARKYLKAPFSQR
jgi:tetratricopeptide (TPR) repeat protein